MTHQYFSNSEIQLLQRNAARHSAAWNARKLGRPYSSVVFCAQRMGLTFLKKTRPYTAADVQYLKDNHLTHSSARLAAALGRTEGAIRIAIFRLRRRDILTGYKKVPRKAAHV
jgi:hypothetical protein